MCYHESRNPSDLTYSEYYEVRAPNDIDPAGLYALPTNAEVIAAVREHIQGVMTRVSDHLHGRRGVVSFGKIADVIYECEAYIRAARFEMELISVDVERTGVMYEGQRVFLNLLSEYSTYAEEDVIAMITVLDQ